jgi:hypothetical protein
MSQPAAPPVISEDYRRQQQALHENPAYGGASIAAAPMVKSMIDATGARSLSDYGAGKQKLREALKEQFGLELDYRPYDPAFPEYGPARPADLVCCIDVLEHVEPDFIDNVLDELAAITVKFGFFTIHTGPATKLLADGRNAHLIQRPAAWWLPKIMARFELEQMRKAPAGFLVVVTPLQSREA